MRDKKDVLRIVFIAGTISAFLSLAPIIRVHITTLFFPNPAIWPDHQCRGKVNLDILIPHFIVTFVPAWLVLIILLLVFSASMSSLSSLVLVSSSAIAIDIYGAYSKAPEKKKTRRTMLYMRILCGLFVLVSLLMAMKQLNFIVNLMIIACGALGGAFLAPYVYGLFWRRTTKIVLMPYDLRSKSLGGTLFEMGQPRHPGCGSHFYDSAPVCDTHCKPFNASTQSERIKQIFGDGERKTKNRKTEKKVCPIRANQVY
jgi:Na+/proline symporter